MKNYIIKSSIVFFMVLILGLILLPIFPTEKEYIYSNGYELLLDEEPMIYDGLGTYFVELPVNNYDLILVSFDLIDLNMSLFTNLNLNYLTYLGEVGQPILAVYSIDDDIPGVIVRTDNYLGDALVKVWGVSK